MILSCFYNISKLLHYNRQHISMYWAQNIPYLLLLSVIFCAAHSLNYAHIQNLILLYCTAKVSWHKRNTSYTVIFHCLTSSHVTLYYTIIPCCRFFFSPKLHIVKEINSLWYELIYHLLHKCVKFFDNHNKYLFWSVMEIRCL